MTKIKKKNWWEEPDNKDMWIKELIKRSTKSVKGYEQYLLNKLNYDELAKIMKELRSILPLSNEEENKSEEK
jgi:hypothetical protein